MCFTLIIVVSHIVQALELAFRDESIALRAGVFESWAGGQGKDVWSSVLFWERVNNIVSIETSGNRREVPLQLFWTRYRRTLEPWQHRPWRGSWTSLCGLFSMPSLLLSFPLSLTKISFSSLLRSIVMSWCRRVLGCTEVSLSGSDGRRGWVGNNFGL